MKRALQPVRAGALGLLLLASAGCAPSAGEDCDDAGFVCESEAAALECRAGLWRRIPCRGAGGCDDSSSTVLCDSEGSQPLDACALTVEGRSVCAAGGTGVLECRQGSWVQVRVCGSCSQSTSGIQCSL